MKAATLNKEEHSKIIDGGRPPMAVILDMISGMWVSRIIYLAAKLGIADLLSEGPKSSEELARATATDSQSLYRVLRALASFGIFIETSDHTFALNPMGEFLRTGPHTLRAFVLMMGEPWQMRTWEEVMYSVKTGKSAFEKANGAGIWEYFGKNREAGRIFDEAMISFSSMAINGVTTQYDFSSFRKIVDVGGGSGHLLAAILKANPQLKGILSDLPGVIEGAKSLITKEGVAQRCNFIAGDCLQSVPDGGDAYLLKHLIHLFQDEQAIAVLKNCRSVMAPKGKLLLIEMVIPRGNEPFYGKLLDVMMLLGPGGRDRTETEYGTLLSAAGFKLTRVISTESPVSIIESVPK